MDGVAPVNSQTFDFVERAVAGGVPVISLLIAVVCAAALYWQFRLRLKLEEDFREELKNAANKNLEEQKGLMREMLSINKEALEAQHATAAALNSAASSLKDVEEKLQDLRAEIARGKRE